MAANLPNMGPLPRRRTSSKEELEKASQRMEKARLKLDIGRIKFEKSAACTSRKARKIERMKAAMPSGDAAAIAQADEEIKKKREEMEAAIKTQLDELKNVKSLEYFYDEAEGRYQVAKGLYRSGQFGELTSDEDSN